MPYYFNIYVTTCMCMSICFTFMIMISSANFNLFYSLIKGAAVISLFYESVLKTCGSVGVHIAYGEVSKGKSNAAKIALAAACNLSHGFQTYLSDSVARQHLSGALPFVFDDPSNNAVLKQILINAFGGAEMATQRSHFSARCVPIVTANTFAVDELTEVDPR